MDYGPITSITDENMSHVLGISIPPKVRFDRISGTVASIAVFYFFIRLIFIFV
jgi:hypothetical protein